LKEEQVQVTAEVDNSLVVLPQVKKTEKVTPEVKKE